MGHSSFGKRFFFFFLFFFNLIGEASFLPPSDRLNSNVQGFSLSLSLDVVSAHMPALLDLVHLGVEELGFFAAFCSKIVDAGYPETNRASSLLVLAVNKSSRDLN